ncbi:unnamed protein product [Phaedon cochleariae]|uniref:DUF4812 domain-containing protein n=1 Tax=Phaedon cochleariae TaxID=80249 RepID=A0A9N9X0M6_PHACE|nr:unnamed protein product [Phaedon cochleariae]
MWEVGGYRRKLIEKQETNKENNDDNNSAAEPYVPGDITEKEHQLPSHDDLAANRFQGQKTPSNGFPRIRDDFSSPLPDPGQDNTKEVEDFCKLNKDMVHAECQRELAESVGWKGHPGYGPTRCTKMKIYRPKTCGHINDGDESISSFDKKWRFLRQSKVTPMDLAICWDMCPENPENEPRRPKHIDGSNGSAAPAVFSLVNTPKEGEENEEKCDGIHGCGPLFHHGNNGNELKEYIFHRSRSKAPSLDSGGSKGSLLKKRAKSAYDDNKSVNSTESVGNFKSRVKSAQNLNEFEKESHFSKEKNNNHLVVANKIHRSTPNLSEDKCSEQTCHRKLKNVSNSKLCVACELKNMSLKERRPKSEYKMAFKAGVPHKTVSRSRYPLRVPKQKDPYMLKNYVIDSLAPPFSLQKAKRQDYPEHWRLATVYQHSYKPIHARKRPLLHTVFK